MSKIIYHLGIGDWLPLDDNILIIDTDESKDDIDEYVRSYTSGEHKHVEEFNSYILERFGFGIAKRFGKRIINLVTN